ncbi:hypothetical protein CRE_24930 [Caenorhabditis remanei]|uniref:Uncharacterized protein n=1 Tax=Caenorhabditis remanei TaxID=31234 RepID=E3MHR9_CAERE|nr:hypothetical protein CRE_24930 [Caenorhabditis remanei]
MHLSFCLLLFASLFGATVQKCCSYPLYDKFQYKQANLVAEVTGWNGCDQSVFIECRGRDWAAQEATLIGNVTTRATWIENRRFVAEGEKTELVCDTSLGLWNYKNEQQKYENIICMWRTISTKFDSYPRDINGVAH